MAIFSGDDSFELAVNDATVGFGDSWQKPTLMDITTALRPGKNTLVAQVVNKAASGQINTAGLIGKIRIELEGASPQEIVTDSSWTSWNQPARVIGPLGIAPWGNLR